MKFPQKSIRSNLSELSVRRSVRKESKEEKKYKNVGEGMTRKKESNWAMIGQGKKNVQKGGSA